MIKVHSEGKIMSKIQVIPQENWLAKSLPNLEELLETIPLNTLVTKKDELELQLEFQEIMCEVNNIKSKIEEEVKPIFKCKKCKHKLVLSKKTL